MDSWGSGVSQSAYIASGVSKTKEVDGARSIPEVVLWPPRACTLVREHPRTHTCSSTPPCMHAHSLTSTHTQKKKACFKLSFGYCLKLACFMSAELLSETEGRLWKCVSVGSTRAFHEEVNVTLSRAVETSVAGDPLSRRSDPSYPSVALLGLVSYRIRTGRKYF